MSDYKMHKRSVVEKNENGETISLVITTTCFLLLLLFFFFLFDAILVYNNIQYKLYNNVCKQLKK